MTLFFVFVMCIGGAADMSILKQYLTRKEFTKPMIQQARENGRAIVPPNWVNYFVGEEMLFSPKS